MMSRQMPTGVRREAAGGRRDRGLGRDVVAAGPAGGHEVVGLGRDPARAALPEAVEVIRGDVLVAGS